MGDGMDIKRGLTKSTVKFLISTGKKHLLSNLEFPVSYEVIKASLRSYLSTQNSSDQIK